MKTNVELHGKLDQTVFNVLPMLFYEFNLDKKSNKLNLFETIFIFLKYPI